MSLLDDVLTILAPHLCIVCDREGFMLCPACYGHLNKVPERCYSCRRISAEAATCKACLRKTHLKQVYVATIYEGVAKELTWRLKYSGARAAAKLMAEVINPKLPNRNLLLVPVPTASKRVRQRGYDQAKLIAKELAQTEDRQYRSLLRRHGQAHQVGATRKQRKQQLESAFTVKKRHQLAGRHILLIDDVLTTGATLESAATALKRAGAKHVSAAVFAQA
jgi:ComF family protein